MLNGKKDSSLVLKYVGGNLKKKKTQINFLNSTHAVLVFLQLNGKENVEMWLVMTIIYLKAANNHGISEKTHARLMPVCFQKILKAGS